jgi:iron complex transport system ATP-binding protein
VTQLDGVNLCVQRGARLLLNNVTLQAHAGEFVAVIGPNGAGKSTLLSVLAGLLKPDAGTVALDGNALGSMPGRKLAQQRAYLPQNPRCEWPIAVERLVALGLTPSLPAFGRLPAGFADRISAALDACDLLQHRHQPATTLSGGELTRAMLARALVGNPQVLIVDEPMSGLDPRHALDTAERLRNLGRAGTLVIASIHDLTLAGRYASRIVALKDGSVQGDGATGATLTPELIRRTFEVEACVSGGGGNVFVDYTALG